MDTLESLLAQYASAIRNVIRQEVFAELRNLTLNELVEISKGSGGAPATPTRRGRATAKAAATPRAGRRVRRSADDINNLLEKVVSFVRDNPGAKSSDIVRGLGIGKKQLPRAISEGLSAGTLTKTGERRATQYFAGEGGKRRKG